MLICELGVGEKIILLHHIEVDVFNTTVGANNETLPYLSTL